MKLDAPRSPTLLVLCLVLTSCGGGGDAPAAGPGGSTQVTAEGVYGGNLIGSSSSNFQALVLENGEFWAIYGMDAGSIFYVDGFVQGLGASNNGTYTASTVHDFQFSPALVGSVNATYLGSAKTIAGSVNYGSNGTVQFSGGPVAGSLYNYDQTPSLSTVSGTWSLLDNFGRASSVTVSSSGAVVTSSGSCAGTGSLVPRASGKNVFNVTLTFGTTGCELPGATVTGVAIAYPLATGQTQLIAAITNSSKTEGLAFFGIR